VSQGVRDLDRAVAFYQDVLGLPLLARFGDLAFFDLGGVRLLLEPAGGPGSILYLAVDDVGATTRQLVGLGVTFEDEPHAIFTDVHGTFGPAGEAEWMTFFRDSEGNLLALSARAAPPT
jgi:methylmalonyl-CoA/ethylmalonyl-CoA epimerase